jgi:glucose/arabinose dehydrogenase
MLQLSTRSRERSIFRTWSRNRYTLLAGACIAALWLTAAPGDDRLAAQGAPPSPTVVDQELAVRTIVGGLQQPTSMAFIGPDDILVLEKGTGRVQRVVNGALQGTVLDLAVNSASERGLLGIALDPHFPLTPFVYLFWTESTTGADSTVLVETPLLGNRVDQFHWNGTALTMNSTVIQLRALQDDVTNGVSRGNHDGGVLRFGPDGKLYVLMGDAGRRGQMQNLPDGHGCAALPCPAIPVGNLPDDQFGGPEPDDAHLTGVILRLNTDGSAPRSNPFFRAGQARGGEAGVNLQKVFAYGIRNSFGMAFDPFSGNLWDEQNGDDSFTELNLVEPGANLGWVQVMGPLARLDEFKTIENTQTMTMPFLGLQQARWPPTLIAGNAGEALARLFMVFEDGRRFNATLLGREEVPSTATGASAQADFRLARDGTLRFSLSATGPIENVTQAHIHLGARGQNGPIVAFLLQNDPAGVDFEAGDTIAEGALADADVIARPGFEANVTSLLARIRQGRTYVNLHTVAFPAGEIRGHHVIDERPVSHYSDPEFSWKFEVAPGGIGFMSSRALGRQYRGDLFTGAARPDLLGGQLFRFKLTGNRRRIAVDDPLLEDRVADNLAKFDITESESLLFGKNFGVATDIQTGPNGNLFVVSLSHGSIYEIFRRR